LGMAYFFLSFFFPKHICSHHLETAVNLF
jgi:hypothetical protein